MNFEGEEGAPYAENKDWQEKKIFEDLAFMVTSKYGECQNSWDDHS
jgi:hypothetical protein